MPSFDVISFGDGLYRCGSLQVAPWVDDGAPSRLASRPGVSEKRYRCQVGSGICLQCRVEGALLLDSDLVPVDTPVGGVFSASLSEGAVQPHWYPSTPNQSAIIRARFDWAGHYAITVSMLGGGSVVVPFDVEAF